MLEVALSLVKLASEGETLSLREVRTLLRLALHFTWLK